MKIEIEPKIGEKIFYRNSKTPFYHVAVCVRDEIEDGMYRKWGCQKCVLFDNDKYCSGVNCWYFSRLDKKSVHFEEIEKDV